MGRLRGEIWRHEDDGGGRGRGDSMILYFGAGLRNSSAGMR